MAHGRSQQLNAGSGICSLTGLHGTDERILRAWSVCMGQTTPAEAMTAASETKALTEMIATRIRAAVTGR